MQSRNLVIDTAADMIYNSCSLSKSSLNSRGLVSLLPEDYIHDCVIGLFSSDIDLAFGMENPLYKELRKLNDALRELPAG